MLNRHIKKELDSYLRIFPVVLLTGSRQTGKTTLVEAVAKEKGYSFVTFDDATVLQSAQRDPQGWLGSLKKPVIIDEIQRLPEIFLAIKWDVDRNRHHGRYLLTGSANPLLLPKLGDSLAGRMGILNLYPFSQGELHEVEESFIQKVFDKEDSVASSSLEIEDMIPRLLKGGFPSVQPFDQLRDVYRWCESYLQTIIERDVRDISNIEGRKEMPRLFRMLAARSSSLLNMAELSRSLGMVNMTLSRYVRLLETLYLVYLVPGWHANLGKRITKSPKLHLSDTAILAQVLQVDEKGLLDDPVLLGKMLESFVFGELVKQQSWSEISFQVLHFRNRDYEVDFVLEKADGSIVGIEVKSAKALRAQDLRGLKALKAAAGKQFHKGIVLHFGSQIQRLDDKIWAWPIEMLWQ